MELIGVIRGWVDIKGMTNGGFSLSKSTKSSYVSLSRGLQDIDWFKCKTGAYKTSYKIFYEEWKIV